jgi:hypothetical protein
MTHFSFFRQVRNLIQCCAHALRRQANALIGVALLLGATAATAVPLTWTLNNVVTADG